MSEEKQWDYHFLFLTPAGVMHQSVNIYGTFTVCGMSPVRGAMGNPSEKTPGLSKCTRSF